MNMGCLSSMFLSLFVLGCASNGGPVFVDAEWNLTCPSGGAAGCGSLAEQTCLGPVGQRAIVGEHRQTLCTGDALIATCTTVPRADGATDVSLEAEADRDEMGFPKFAFELGAKIRPGNGSVESCNVNIIEDGVPYNVGACGVEPPSMEQPCQLSNVSIAGDEVAFDLECNALMSSITVLGFDVGGIGGGRATIRFSNCSGL